MTEDEEIRRIVAECMLQEKVEAGEIQLRLVRKCPYCDEDISVRAVVCPHCRWIVGELPKKPSFLSTVTRVMFRVGFVFVLAIVIFFTLAVIFR